MTIMQSLHFYFDGNFSKDLGIVNCQVGSSSNMYSEILTGKRVVTEVKTRNRKKPFFLNIDYDPIDFTVELAFMNGFTDDQIREIGRIFIHDDYKELYFTDNPDKRFYVVVIDAPTLNHNGLGQGYLTLHFRNIDGFAYSPVYTSPVYDTSTTGSMTIKFANNGDWILSPEVTITKVGNGDFSIVNATNGGLDFTFTNLIDGENVYVDCDKQYIESSFPNVYRYQNFSDNYLELPTGVNTLQVTGNAVFTFRYQYKLMM